MKWAVFASRGCNIGDGEVIHNIFPGWRYPWLSFNNIRRRVDFRQVEPRGMEVKRRRSFNF